MIERRFLTASEAGAIELEERAAGSPRIRGTAAVYNSPSKILEGRYREVIEPGAFDHLIDQRRSSAAEVVALWNHDQSQLLGRTSAKTLKLWSDERGLHYEIDPVPNTSLGRDLVEHLKLGNVTGSSFAFTVDPKDERVERGEDGQVTRYIKRASGLFDVSPVTNPAYEATAVNIRSFEAFEVVEPEATPQPEPQPLTAADRLKVAKARAHVACVAARAAVEDRNCGNGDGGFKPGNTCAKGGFGDGIDPPKGSHGVKLPKDRSKLTIGHASSALKQLGYSLGAAKFSPSTKETTYEIKDSKGRKKKVPMSQIKDVVYGHASE